MRVCVATYVGYVSCFIYLTTGKSVDAHAYACKRLFCGPLCAQFGERCMRVLICGITSKCMYFVYNNAHLGVIGHS